VFTAAEVAGLLGSDSYGIELLLDRLVRDRFFRPMAADSLGETLFGITPFVAMFVQSEDAGRGGAVTGPGPLPQVS
jgi:hypothetical protein